LALALAAATASPAAASIWVANGGRAPTLQVDARGNAEIGWHDARGAHTLLVPRSGSVLPGGRLTGRDISRPIPSSVAMAVVTRRTPDGRYWALQRWQVLPNGPVELHFARWTGEPTTVTAEVANDHLTGSAAYHGRPVYGYSPTTAGK